MVLRCRGAAWLAAALLVPCHCAPHEAAPPPRGPAARSRWPEFERAAEWTLVRASSPSRGHAPGRYRVEVRVDPPEAAAAYRALVAGAALPPSTRIAAFHRARDGSAGSVYAMEKLASGEWAFTAAEPDGTLARGEVSLCRQCHEAAPADFVFGIPEEPAERR